jgi:predicted small lipoprotein YifL
MRKFLLAMAAIFGLASCGAEPIWAPDEAVAAAR